MWVWLSVCGICTLVSGKASSRSQMASKSSSGESSSWKGSEPKTKAHRHTPAAQMSQL